MTTDHFKVRIAWNEVLPLRHPCPVRHASSGTEVGRIVAVYTGEDGLTMAEGIAMPGIALALNDGAFVLSPEVLGGRIVNAVVVRNPVQP